MPGNKLPNATWLNSIKFDKIVHLLIFMGLTFSTFSLFKQVSKLKAFFIGLYCIFFGILVEIVQKYFVLNRSFDIFDIVADTIGVLIGLILINKLVKK